MIHRRGAERVTRKHAVFVYGTLKSGFPNHFFLEDSEFVGHGRTRELYSLYQWEYPIVFKGEKLSHVKGEVYIVDDFTLTRLDQLEEHPDFYRRELVEIELDSGFVMSAWLYFFPKAQGKALPGGEWLGGVGLEME